MSPAWVGCLVADGVGSEVVRYLKRGPNSAHVGGDEPVTFDNEMDLFGHTLSRDLSDYRDGKKARDQQLTAVDGAKHQ